MVFLAFIGGLIVGLLIRHYQHNPEQLQALTQNLPFVGTKPEPTQFVEPVNAHKRFEEAEDLSDILDG